MGMKVAIIDPSRMVKNQPRARWNPFRELDRAAERARREGRDPDNAVVVLALKFAEGLIIRYGKENPFWAGSAKEFLHGAILFIRATEPRERQTLERLYELVTVGLPELVSDPKKETGFDVLLKLMARNPAYGGAIASGATFLMGGARETVGSVTMTFREQLKWLKLPAMKECSAESDFDLEELKTGKLVLFICAKVSEVSEDFPGWFRLLTVMALHTFEDIPGGLKKPCLFALDEFPSLGKLDRVEIAAPLMRGYGVRLLDRLVADYYEK
jgi:type IV secretory pathway TraG/TraD family ATPase VirD4